MGKKIGGQLYHTTALTVLSKLIVTISSPQAAADTGLRGGGGAWMVGVAGVGFWPDTKSGGGGGEGCCRFMARYEKRGGGGCCRFLAQNEERRAVGFWPDIVVYPDPDSQQLRMDYITAFHVAVM